jgi:ABC-type polysaccharide/polyol phosphate export permease
MKILKNTVTILFEIIILILAVLWYKKTPEYEPLIAIIVSFIALISSFGSRLFFSRPIIELHHVKTDFGRSPKGYTTNNPPIIRV